MGFFWGYVLVQGFFWVLLEALGFFRVLIFALIRSSPSLEIRNTPPGVGSQQGKALNAELKAQKRKKKAQ